MSCPFWKAEDYPNFYEYQVKAFEMFNLDGKCIIDVPGAFFADARLEERHENYFIVSAEVKTPQGPLKVRWRRTQNEATWQLDPLIKDESELDKLEYAISELLGGWRFYSKACSEAKKRIGDQGIVGPIFYSPAAWAAFYARGTVGFFKDLYCNTYLAERLIELGYEYHTKICTDIAIDSGADFINPAWCAGIGPRFFEKYELPYLKREVDRAHEAGLKTILHIDGRASAILELATQTGADGIETLDPPTMTNGDVELGDAKKRVGDRICLMGNVDTINVLLRGTPEEVEKAVKKCIVDAAHGGGYILSTSDNVCKGTPISNMDAFARAGLKYGKYVSA